MIHSHRHLLLNPIFLRNLQKHIVKCSSSASKSENAILNSYASSSFPSSAFTSDSSLPSYQWISSQAEIMSHNSSLILSKFKSLTMGFLYRNCFAFFSFAFLFIHYYFSYPRFLICCSPGSFLRWLSRSSGKFQLPRLLLNNSQVREPFAGF